MLDFFKIKPKAKTRIKNVNISNLNNFLKKIKPTLSCGEVKKSNIILKNKNNKIKKVLMHLFNVSISNACVPERW
jgi:hypothetical protein